MRRKMEKAVGKDKCWNLSIFDIISMDMDKSLTWRNRRGWFLFRVDNHPPNKGSKIIILCIFSILILILINNLFLNTNNDHFFV